MSDVFISYARSTELTAQTVAEALRGLGYSVWLDDELPAHRAYSDVIEERLRAAKSVVVIWSADAVKSEWVRSEAALAREGRKLVQLTIDHARLPMPFDQTQCADLAGWTGQPDTPGWRQVTASIAELTTGPAQAYAAEPRPGRHSRRRRARSLTPSDTGSTPEDNLRRVAARKADAEIRLRKHALNYVMVNAGLAAINLVTDPHELWFQYPLIFWGLGLGAQALSVYHLTHEGREERIARKLEQMRRTDPPPPV
jgi:TIR domain/2TM domain